MPASDLDDPRTRPAGLRAANAYEAARRAIDAPTAAEADGCDVRAREWLVDTLARADGEALADALERAPSPAIARHLRRLLADIEGGTGGTHDALRTMLFAIPCVVVAALDAGAPPVTLDAIVPDASALATILRDARAFAGCETFALSASLVAADAIGLRALPALLARVGSHDSTGSSTSLALDLPPAPIDVQGSVERVHLRFIAGALLAPAQVDPLHDSPIVRWGMPFARALARALAVPGVSLLALPRPAQRLVAAVQSGRTAQRDVSAQLFASNAIRRFRASYGEPTAIVSAHRADDAPGGGELRLSLSSPFAPKAAEGFRCPVYPYETVQEVGAMLDALLRDCRVSDVRFVPGVHDDVDPLTHGPLFFKDVAVSPGPSLH